MKYKLYSAEQVNEFHARNTEGDDKIRNHLSYYMMPKPYDQKAVFWVNDDEA